MQVIKTLCFPLRLPVSCVSALKKNNAEAQETGRRGEEDTILIGNFKYVRLVLTFRMLRALEEEFFGEGFLTLLDDGVHRDFRHVYKGWK